jgi:hypothetical protein
LIEKSDRQIAKGKKLLVLDYKEFAMFPSMQWSPSYNFPFSGAVNQDISPHTDFFSQEIEPDAGDAEIEREVFHSVASYGKQLGILTDSLLAVVRELKPEAISEIRALEQLQTLQRQVEKVKNERLERTREKAKQILDKLAQTDPEFLAELLGNYSQVE